MSAFDDIPDEFTLTKDELRRVVNMTVEACWDAVRWEEGLDSGVLWLKIKRLLVEGTLDRVDADH